MVPQASEWQCIEVTVGNSPDLQSRGAAGDDQSGSDGAAQARSRHRGEERLEHHRRGRRPPIRRSSGASAWRDAAERRHLRRRRGRQGTGQEADAGQESRAGAREARWSDAWSAATGQGRESDSSGRASGGGRRSRRRSTQARRRGSARDPTSRAPEIIEARPRARRRVTRSSVSQPRPRGAEEVQPSREPSAAPRSAAGRIGRTGVARPLAPRGSDRATHDSSPDRGSGIADPLPQPRPSGPRRHDRSSHPRGSSGHRRASVAHGNANGRPARRRTARLQCRRHRGRRTPRSRLAVHDRCRHSRSDPSSRDTAYVRVCRRVRAGLRRPAPVQAASPADRPPQVPPASGPGGTQSSQRPADRPAASAAAAAPVPITQVHHAG